MSFLLRRVSRLQSFPFHVLQNGAGHKYPVVHERLISSVTKSVEAKQFNPYLVTPTFTQVPPAWVRYAWLIIIANTLLMGSAIEITWNHWATLVKDLEEIGEKNRSTVTGPSTETVQEQKKENYHWEQRPTWQRATFCGIYGFGWGLSTLYLLKYRQTFVTSLRFFRSTTLFLSKSPPTSKILYAEPKLGRFVHISTASNTTGVSLLLDPLTIQDGRNETELVIRYSTPPATAGAKSQKKRRDYWYVSLTDAQVQGAKFGNVVSARDNIIWAWDGVDGNNGPILTAERVVEEKEKLQTKKNKKKKQPQWHSGPVLKK